MTTTHFIEKKYQSGFVILFTILISAIIFSMGLGIYSIAIRQTILSSTSREAMQAFYSADAGIECTLLAEVGGNITNQTMGSCDQKQIDFSNNPAQVVFGDRNLCSLVTIITGTGQRRLVARGFNGDCPTGSPGPRAVERDLDVVYGI